MVRLRQRVSLQIKKMKRKSGQASTELAASLMFIIPLMLVAVYVVTQCVQAYTIYCTLKQASAQAARRFAVAYIHNPDLVRKNYGQVCYSVEYPGVVNSYKQFELVEFSPDAIPPTVTMRVHFAPEIFGCRRFPEPDILGISKHFKMSAQTTEKLD